MAVEAISGQWVWIVPLIPVLPALAFFVGIIGGGLGLHKRVSNLTIGAMALSCLLAWGTVFLPVLLNFLGGLQHGHPEPFSWSHNWFWAGAGGPGDGLFIGVMVDHLTAAMLAMVTLVVLMIEVYAVGYMAHEPHYGRFHSYVSLFAAGMLGLVVSNNYLTLLVSWEIMGVCSYLLIGFWYHKDSARKAAKKAFMVTRLGDCGMLIGIFIAYAYCGSFQFEQVFLWAKTAAPVLVALTALGLFMGSVGKSAQFPLHVWLPDAMEGPTPVSALIHAATMVSAGVYLVARSYPLFYGAHGDLAGDLELTALGQVYTLEPLTVVAWIGGFTALFAATMAVFAADIKKVLAYSTISQLGYMFLALGVGGYTAAVFHLLTHAFFKALLFLGSGSVIHAVEHAMHHEHVHEDPQNMYHMGALWTRMPATAWTFLLGTLALAGVPPFAGFFSKDEVLLEALRGHHANPILGGFGLAVAFLTAFYMTRLLMLTFFGRPRFPQVWAHTEDSPAVMTRPLMVLAIFAVILGLPAAPAFFGGENYVHAFLNMDGLALFGVEAPHALRPDFGVATIATLLALSGIVLGVALYGTPAGAAARRLAWGNALLRAAMTAPKRLYWMNELLYAVFVVPTFAVMRWCNAVDRYVIDLTVNLVGWLTLVMSNGWRWFDQTIIDKVGVEGPARTAQGVAEVGKFAQTGKVQGYALVAVTGLLLLVAVRVWLVR
ncbi:MAG: NADH-quinone oxidoreductase subunit L [Fimbriimonadaceae bacterium]|nr:NADH-quinone oxidoreductase subunit L [Fimbriimonadaceae bacterium]